MAKAPKVRVPFDEVMAALEAAGSAQTRKTYLRHGACEPLFGVSFATLKALLKRIGVDHELAVALWDTGNYDARNLAVKVADPKQLSLDDLNRWLAGTGGRMLVSYVAMLACDAGDAVPKAEAWLGSDDPTQRAAGWYLVGRLAMTDPAVEDAWFLGLLARAESEIHGAANQVKEAANQAVIAIGCRNATLRAAAESSARRIGAVDVDHGDTACETPDAVPYIDKAWAWSTGKGFASPAAQEQTREPLRLRC